MTERRGGVVVRPSLSYCPVRVLDAKTAVMLAVTFRFLGRWTSRRLRDLEAQLPAHRCCLCCRLFSFSLTHGRPRYGEGHRESGVGKSLSPLSSLSKHAVYFVTLRENQSWLLAECCKATTPQRCNANAAQVLKAHIKDTGGHRTRDTGHRD